MTHRVFSNRLSFQKTDPENPTVPVGDPVIVKRGDKVPEWVTPFQVNALVNAGMIVPTGDEDRADLRPAEDVPVQPRTQDQPNVLPSDPNGGPVTLMQDSASTVALSSAQDPDKPSVRDSKEAWESYAASPAVGMPLAEAQSMSKTKLIEEVDRRERAVVDRTGQ